MAGSIRGRLVQYLPRGGTPEQFVFQYNPTTITESKSVQWAEANIPGADDSLATFGSGSSLKLTLNLFLNVYGDSPEFRNNPDFVENSIQFLYRYAEVDRKRQAGRQPPLLLLSLGQLKFAGALTTGAASAQFPALLVRITELEVERTIFGSETYKTLRANAKVTLVRHVGFPR